LPLIGTAGHVDHGKSTLVEALTGRDPDRWAEEKRRGLTIDLGFAWTTIGSTGEVSFVDVPGHERFLKNMLAGIEAIDVALFVVAADEGWMPQSEEHLAVLDLLGIDSGVVALTKTDAVDEEAIALVEMEITERLAGTTLESAPIIPVSARTGAGLRELLAALDERVSVVTEEGDRPRLWVDRAFSVPGSGTVVTGTLTEGPMTVGDEVELFPDHQRGRVRGLQSHETTIDHALPGRRLAVNLTGIDRADAVRGSMLGLPGQWDLTGRFTAQLQIARYVDRLPAKGAFHVHIGSGAHPAVIKRTEADRALFEIARPLPLRTGDRFILRESGRRQVVAGGVVLDPAPGRPAQAMRTSGLIDPKAGRDAIATTLLGIRGVEKADRLAAHSGGGRPEGAVIMRGVAVTRERFDELRSESERLVAEYLDHHALRPGMPLATLAAGLGSTPEMVEMLIGESKTLQRIGPDVASTEHPPALDPGAQAEWARAEAILEKDLAVPPAGDLGLGRELLHRMIREGRLIRVSDDLVFLPGQIEEIRGQLDRMTSPFTVAQFRDQTGLSRKYAVPILEWADREGLTIRRGDERHLR
jgi:selenocysteine-specific elongation factor